MPYRRKYKKTYKKKSNRRSYSSFTSQPATPQTLVRKLRYSTQDEINPGAGGAAGNLFIRANSIFDPEVAVGGHQPMGFDQYMLMYDRWTILGSKITVQFLPQGTGVLSQTVCSVSLDDDTTANTSMSSMIEQGLANWRLQTSADAASKALTLTKTFSKKRRFPNRMGAAELMGTVSGDAAEVVFYNISCAGLGAADANVVKLLITVDYIVSFTGRTTLIQS